MDGGVLVQDPKKCAEVSKLHGDRRSTRTTRAIHDDHTTAFSDINYLLRSSDTIPRG